MATRLFRLRRSGFGPGLALAAASLAGCGHPPPPGQPAGSKPKLSELRPYLRTREDSLVLDLLLGYRALRAGNRKDTLRLADARRASQQLEAELRQGGLVRPAPGAEPAPAAAPGEAGLGGAARALAEAAAEASLRGDWDRARSLWEGMVRDKEAVKAAVADAAWGVALCDGMRGGLDEKVKGDLRALNAAYFRGAPQADISRQVLDAVKELPEGPLRVEAKKLPGRAYDREQGRGRPAGPAPATGAATRSQVDSLGSAGHYLEAARALARLEPGARGGEEYRQGKRRQLAEAYCGERRAAAARIFQESMRVTRDSSKAAYLRRAEAELDSCLANFGDTPAAEQARKNRETVEAEARQFR